MIPEKRRFCLEADETIDLAAREADLKICELILQICEKITENGEFGESMSTEQRG
ncbi:hypothetical protein HanXRQr2_Chr17g0780771 [Helianthus annuus]|uniref:Uncharacterized protein n=1 Tax=Helianthus annuus TaxID=4232 RepID=A0A9K3DES0_HELAN|nr:hypothetical protein HanXRQr2_Chr17g0780771 [Helianthus annuus]